MKRMMVGLIAVFALGGCGIKQSIQKSDDRYMEPGAMDEPLSDHYNTYVFKFMDRYKVTHDTPVDGGCGYHGVITKVSKGTSYDGEIRSVRDIFEKDEKTWQRYEEIAPLDLSSYFRSIKVMRPVSEVVGGVRRKTGKDEEVEIGLRPICFKSWYNTGHTLILRVYKRDIATWREQWSELNPRGKWSTQRLGNNDWWLLANDEEALLPAPPTGMGGWFQSWLLPIGDTGYSMSIQLGANQKSLQYPETHEQMKATLRHMVESVKIEALP